MYSRALLASVIVGIVLREHLLYSITVLFTSHLGRLDYNLDISLKLQVSQALDLEIKKLAQLVEDFSAAFVPERIPLLQYKSVFNCLTLIS